VDGCSANSKQESVIDCKLLRTCAAKQHYFLKKPELFPKSKHESMLNMLKQCLC
jgi:hypothetical protein